MSPAKRLLLLSAFAALLPPHAGAARLDGSLESAFAMTAHAPDARAVRDRELRLAQEYVDQVVVKSSRRLTYIRDNIDRLEVLRTKVLEIGAFRDAHSRQLVRDVLRDIRLKSDKLSELAAKKEAEGEVDDGGSVPPSRRKNICRTIDRLDVEAEFRQELKRLCAALDTVRAIVASGGNQEEAMFEVSGRLTTLRTKPDYAVPIITMAIGSLLGEEKRWVTRQLAQRSAGVDASAASDAPPGSANTRAAPLSTWNAEDDIVSPHLDSVMPERILKEACAVVERVTVQENMTLSHVRTGLARLEFSKEQVAALVTASDPTSRERIRDLLHEIKEKSDALHALSEQKVAAGEGDDGGNELPSRRDNICRNVDSFGLEPALRKEVQKLCECLDKVRELILAGEDPDAALFEVLGRVTIVKNWPGYAEMPMAVEIEVVIGEEWRWVYQHLATRPTQPPPPMPPKLWARDLIDARKLVQGMNSDGTDSLAAIRDDLDRLDLLKEQVLAVGVPMNPRLRPQVRRIVEIVNQKATELKACAALLDDEDEVADSADVGGAGEGGCMNVDAYGFNAETRMEAQDICRAFDRVRAANADGAADSATIVAYLGELARRAVALFTASPHASNDFLLMMAREKRSSLARAAFEGGLPTEPPAPPGFVAFAALAAAFEPAGAVSKGAAAPAPAALQASVGPAAKAPGVASH